MGSARDGWSRQYWTDSPGQGRLREVPRPAPGPGEVLVKTTVSGISRGTETLIHRGGVPPSITHLMTAPLQLGELPFPVSHGYLNVGTVLEGPEELSGRQVFTLGGHRDHIIAAPEDCHPLPEGCPPERALLAGGAEVALNGLWEGQVTVGDRVAVVGAGMIGLSTALLADRFPLQRLQVVETSPHRREAAAGLGLDAVSPDQAQQDNDVVLHSSASSAGLRTALTLTGDDGAVVEQSWYGTSEQQIPLGADFHARRLRLLSTQVGEVPLLRRHRRSRGDRLRTALDLLDPRFDALITGRSPLEKLPQVMDDLAAGADWTRQTICHVIDH
ncbi:zinc-dependent alcohol dehydrogenase [Nesterenkonia cremea]|uniref:Dehydrogenase n=1 Tax=Nesterenkonia cremea TaxID=1882340 RepID=A0A917ANP4_9MICC|nr:zinc-binding alcohol dehydrogenase [Nesterenkonia cremea]GGE64040.1 dehydrogenase [Nesterenkonia cremea]